MIKEAHQWFARKRSQQKMESIMKKNLKDLLDMKFLIINSKTKEVITEMRSRIDAVRLKIMLLDSFGIDSVIEEN